MPETILSTRQPASAIDASSVDPLWYKDAVIYQFHVRAFYDSNSDGIGDFPGLTEKLDYLQDLGVTAVWLLPFYPSPLRDDGYDIADYFDVNPSYGTLADFKTLHPRGARPRPEGHHRDGAQSHLGPASLVSAGAASQAGQLGPRFLCLERHDREVSRRADHLQGLRGLELVLGSGGQGQLLAPLLLASARFEFRQSAGRRKRCST